MLIASLLKIIKQHVYFCTCESSGTFGSWEGNIKNNCKLSEVFHIFPRFTLRFSEREVKAPCFTQCCFSSSLLESKILDKQRTLTRKNCFRYLKLMSPLKKNNYLTFKSKVWSRSHEGHYGWRHTALWSCTHIPNIHDLSGKTKKLRSGQASLRRSGSGGRRKNQTKTICLPSFEGET